MVRRLPQGLVATKQTTIVIAHRLSILLPTDRVMVLDQGQLVGDGSHPLLLAECSPYNRLVAPQLRSPLAELG